MSLGCVRVTGQFLRIVFRTLPTTNWISLSRSQTVDVDRNTFQSDLFVSDLFFSDLFVSDLFESDLFFLFPCHRKGDWLTIPNGWLCYLSPEIMRCLRPGDQQNEALPFTSSSDVFAFGSVSIRVYSSFSVLSPSLSVLSLPFSFRFFLPFFFRSSILLLFILLRKNCSQITSFSTLWFELLYGEWPFKGYLPEVIIWQVGSGYKPALCNLQASKEIKVRTLEN